MTRTGNAFECGFPVQGPGETAPSSSQQATNPQTKSPI